MVDSIIEKSNFTSGGIYTAVGTYGFQEMLQLLEHLVEATTKYPAIRCIPKVILSTSNSEKEKESCYFRGASSYIVKPLKYEDYVQTIARILNYWSINEIVH